MIGIGPGDARYPPRLLDLRSPPDPLWVDGHDLTLGTRAVSIVGTRRMTPYGARVARELASACAEAGIVVVSGLAQGIDSAAHAGVLEAGGRTVAVLGAGVVSYLDEARGRRRRLAHAIRANGALVSEFPPQAPPRNWMFAQRDATIAALGELTVVVEAPIGSGALITAAEANRLRRPVYAVPGPIGVAGSAGGNALIASGGAKALTGPAMLVEVLGMRAVPITPTEGDDLAMRVLDALAASPADLDSLARRLGISTESLARATAKLMVRGEIASAPDGRLARR
ncbi:MAG: DNA-processing protein DprA [Chloroflexi bacterium]|nr:MAG: DNA-processing protein DprA [Chloroflexota bacterium]